MSTCLSIMLTSLVALSLYGALMYLLTIVLMNRRRRPSHETCTGEFRALGFLFPNASFRFRAFTTDPVTFGVQYY
jgi:hypothetical protein